MKLITTKPDFGVSDHVGHKLAFRCYRSSQCPDILSTVMIHSFRTDRSGQTVQTQILEEQSDQDLHRLLLHLHLFDKILYGLASLFELYVDYSKVFWRPKIKEHYRIETRDYTI